LPPAATFLPAPALLRFVGHEHAKGGLALLPEINQRIRAALR
jgi:hypothetical protein